MSDSFQHEIPKGRVNLTVEIQTNGAAKSIELPHKTLVLADFSNGRSKGPLAERERKSITTFTRDHVMQEYSPVLNLSVDNKLGAADEELQIQLQFKKLKDFHPESLVEQVPVLKRMLAMRNLLKDLRANLMDNTALKHKLGEILTNESSVAELKTSLNHLLPQAKPQE